MIEQAQYLLGTFSVCIILALSASGACSGMSSCGTSSILHTKLPVVITYSYISMIMISTIFFYGFILAIVIINKLTQEYTTANGMHHLVASLIFGLISFFSGRAMGEISADGFKIISKKPSFYVSYIVCLASVEVTLVIGFLCSLLVIYKVK